MPGTRYVNLRTKTLIETFNEGKATFTIATVTEDGYGRRRQVRAAAFHPHYLASDGQPHTSGYVPVASLPGNHPRAMKTEIDRMELLDHIEQLSNAELADLILEQQRIKGEAETLIDRAKAVVKSRRKTEGLEVHGNVTMVFTPGKRFDAKTAAGVLSVEQLLSISVPRPDTTRAKKVLGEDSELYKKCQKDNGFTLTVRETTDEDRLKVLAERDTEDADDAGGIEIFELDEPPF